MTVETRKTPDILKAIETLLQGETVTVNTTLVAMRKPFVKVADHFTRPATTTQYTVGDEVSNNATQASAVALHFVDVVEANAGTGTIVKALLEISSKNVVNGSFRLYLFNAAPTMVGDNLGYALLHADRTTRVGHIDFTLLSEAAASDCAEAIGTPTDLRFVAGAAAKDLWGVLVAEAGYTPAAGSEVVTVTLLIDPI